VNSRSRGPIFKSVYIVYYFNCIYASMYLKNCHRSYF